MKLRTLSALIALNIIAIFTFAGNIAAQQTNINGPTGAKDDSDEGGYGTDAPVMMSNSVLGTTANGGNSQNFSYDAANNQIVVGRPFDNIVTLFGGLAPSAASVTVAGKVSDGRAGISGAIVSLTDETGAVRTTRTNSFGYYSFEEVEVGQTVTIQGAARRYNFAPQVVTVNEEIEDLNFTAQ